MFKTLISIVGVGAAIGLFLLYTKPTYDSVKTLQAQIAEYDQALEKAAELKRLKDTLLSRYNAFNPADIERLHKLLPDHVDNVRLLLDLDTLAARHGLAIQNVVISGNSSETLEQTVVTTIGESNEKYDSISIKFATEGTYDQFKIFMRDLERSLRIVDIESLNLSRNAASTGGEPVFRYDIAVKTYWLK